MAPYTARTCSADQVSLGGLHRRRQGRPRRQRTGLAGGRTTACTHEDAGTVTVLYSHGTKIGTIRTPHLGQPGYGRHAGQPGKGDNMGFTMTSGDSNGDGKKPTSPSTPTGDAFVTVVKGAAAGLSFCERRGVDPELDRGARASASRRRVGRQPAVRELQGRRSAGAGGRRRPARTTERARSRSLYSTSSGLTGTGSKAFSQSTSGVPEFRQAGDGSAASSAGSAHGWPVPHRGRPPVTRHRNHRRCIPWVGGPGYRNMSSSSSMISAV